MLCVRAYWGNRCQSQMTSPNPGMGHGGMNTADGRSKQLNCGFAHLQKWGVLELAW